VLHLGGGTPTYLSPDQIQSLFSVLRQQFPLLERAEVSAEIDPRVTTSDQIETLKASGVNRVSLGVQDLDEGVQEAIGRFQSAEQTIDAYSMCRSAGFERINLDLVYGLPGQSTETVAATVDRVIRLRPDRIALYGFAHVPWMRPNQKSIDPESLPRASDRLRLFLTARSLFLGSGYVAIGMDHFALPDDDLAHAARERRLGRNFMGYTPHAALEILGLGLSSIGHLGGAYVQDPKRLSRYYRLLDDGTLPVERGYRCTRDDDLRRLVIHSILCQGSIDFAGFEREAGVPFQVYFREEEAATRSLEESGLVDLGPDGIDVTPLGSLLLRNVAMVFDRFHRSPLAIGPRFSQTV
jgi:oxygen-independent coproporphyrinogen-3 oxidase